MNREIKFRAWDGKEMLQNYLVVSPTPSGKGLMTSEIMFSPISVMQFTGLKDKNGKEIYEGDVIEYPEIHWEESRTREEDREVVKWSDSHTGFYPFMGDYYAADPKNCSVIGNIYENPDLLALQSKGDGI